MITTVSLFSCAEDKSNSNEQEAGNAIEVEEVERSTREGSSERNIEELIRMTKIQLKEKLDLSDELLEEIGNMYQNAYLSAGGSLEDSAPREKAREIQKSFIKSTKEEVLPLLTEDQARFYRRFAER